MKTVKLSSVILLLIVLMTGFISAQETTRFYLDRNIKLTNASKTEEIIIEVNRANCLFQFDIKSQIQKGELEIEVYDPNGKKQSSFSVGCQITSTSDIKNKNAVMNDFFNGKKTKPTTDKKTESVISEKVSGSTSHSIQNALAGKWIVKFIPKNASGYISLVSKQTLNNIP